MSGPAIFILRSSFLSLADNQTVLVQVKETSVRIDGDKLSFEGLVYQDEKK
ncbi:MAG: hypothetical protein U5K84_01040 [Alkalibacterium sp.]|nr:hypothetical protein [Alkalibacterium sp.]